MTLDWEPVRPAWREARGPTMRPPSRLQTKALAAGIALVMGFLVGVQSREQGGTEGRLAAESTEDLTRILSDLNAEADRLARDVSELRVRETELRSTAGREEVLLEQAREELADLQVLAGIGEATGPGVVVSIGDRGGGVRWEAVLDTVQELRDAGAEAIAIGPVRVVASTWLGPARGGVSVSGTVVGAPYEIVAIGDARGMREALEIPGGPLVVLGAQPGVSVSVTEAGDLRVPALQRRRAFRYARPA